MDRAQIVRFLDAQKDLDTRLRDSIQRMHCGRWPTWRARSFKRAASQIIEVATPCRRQQHDQYMVLRWYWNDRQCGLMMRDFGTLREAEAYKERMVSIDATQPDIRA